MSPQSRIQSFKALEQIDDILGKAAVSATDQVTPKILLEHLKKPSDRNEGILTILGQLIKDQLPKCYDFEQLRWIVFHFSTPFYRLSIDESQTRNWLSMHSSDQELLDAVHEETINKGREYIASIYAPSVVSGKLENTDLRKKWWLYHMNSCQCNWVRNEHFRCGQSIPTHSDMMCFFDAGDNIIVESCNGDHTDKEDKQICLGQLLGGEEEALTRERYLEFVKLIRKRSRNNTKKYSGDALLKCTHYARIPFFYNRQKYTTEVFVAFDSTDTGTVVNALHELVPLLKLLVSIINSHVAYTYAEEEGEWQGQFRSVSTVAHAFATPLRVAAALAGEISDDIPQKASLVSHIGQCRQLDQFGRALYKRMSSGQATIKMTNHRTLTDFVEEVKKCVLCVCTDLEKADVGSLGSVIQLLVENDNSLFDVCATDIALPHEDLTRYVEWNSDQLYVMAYGLLSNAIKHHKLKDSIFDAQIMEMYHDSERLPYLRVNLKLDSLRQHVGVYLVVENDCMYGLEEAEREVERLSNCSQADWIGVSLLHIASEALGYTRPRWEAIKSQPCNRFHASGQIARIPKRE